MAAPTGDDDVSRPRVAEMLDPSRSALEIKGPYFSPKRNNDLALNSKAMIGSEPVICGHLSTRWEQQFNVGGKPDYGDFSSVERIQSWATPEIQAACSDRLGSQVQFVDNDAWGSWIAGAFRTMEAEGRTLRSIRVLTPNHAMALGLRIKEQDGARSYIVKFYEPNRTATHQRAQAGAPEAFRRLTALSFLQPASMTRFNMTPPGAVVFLGDTVPEQVRQDIRVEHASASTFFLLMQLGLAVEVRRFGQRLLALGWDAPRLAALLGVKTNLGTPPLFMALQNNHADAIREYGKILKGARLDSAQWFDLLTARRYNGVPGLCMALHKRHANAIREYCQILQAPELDPAQRLDLLAARRADGTCALYRALQTNDVGTIEAYGMLFRHAGLDRSQRATLLTAPSGHGTTGLVMAMQCNASATRAYGKLIRDADLDPSQLLALLAAKDAQGNSPLFLALMQNNAEAIEAYGVLLDAAGLDPTQRVELLGATCADGRTGLLLALQKNNARAIQAYATLFRGTRLDTPRCLALLAPKDTRGVPAVFLALWDKNAEALHAFAELLQGVGLDPPQRASLLNAMRHRRMTTLGWRVESLRSKRRAAAMQAWDKVVAALTEHNAPPLP